MALDTALTCNDNVARAMLRGVLSVAQLHIADLIGNRTVSSMYNPDRRPGTVRQLSGVLVIRLTNWRP